MGNLDDPGVSRRQRSRLRICGASAIAIILYLQFSILPQYLYTPPPSASKLSRHRTEQLKFGLQQCRDISTPNKQYATPNSSRTNPRWNSVSGQNHSILLRGATLFDGEKIIDGWVDILLEKGVIISVSDSHSTPPVAQETIQLHGQFVTPGLVDMHSHHLVESWPELSSTSDGNEVNPFSGPLTPFVRSLDSMRPNDPAMAIIASGGITTSLILPGSANIMGGEGFLVKNYVKGGENGEEVIEDVLFEHGIPRADRRRYMKMACGENPRRVYHHTRMGNAWILRKQMARAQELVDKQETWCLSAAAAQESRQESAIALLASTAKETFSSVDAFELESTAAILRGKMGVNIHCYEPEDFEDMLLHSKEFGFRIQAFHHALSAWKVPEMIKESGDNITIATFSDFGFYKTEAYDANLWAGKILSDHGLPVAYKSDHSAGELNAKYLMFSAASAHSFHLPEFLALQSVTSVPAKSLEIDHRVGYARSGYDADLVVWDSHPLSVGATPIEVYIDGKPTLDNKQAMEALSPNSDAQSTKNKPQMRTKMSSESKSEMCGASVGNTDKEVVIRGIKTSFLDEPALQTSDREELNMVIRKGKVSCFGSTRDCVSTSSNALTMQLDNGYVLPGLTAMTFGLGLIEVGGLPATGDGYVSKKMDVSEPENVDYAKYGIHLDGRAFKRARYGGVTRAITHPLSGGFLSGVSVGIKTGGNRTILDGGIFQDDIALHFVIGEDAKATESTPTISGAVGKLRAILNENKGKDNVYGKAVSGDLPLVTHTESKDDILQLIRIKQQYPSLNLVIYGGSGAPFVATELAASSIPVILAPFRSSPDSWAKADCLVGPPLTPSSVSILTAAGVTFALASGSENSDATIHNLILEAAWAAKYAGLSPKSAVDLVSRNLDAILGLKKEGVMAWEGDFVVWEGNPLEFGGSVVVSVDGENGVVMDCWPDVQ